MMKINKDENEKHVVKKIKSIETEVKKKEVKIDDQTPKSKFKSAKLMFEKKIEREAKKLQILRFLFKISDRTERKEKTEKAG